MFYSCQKHEQIKAVNECHEGLHHKCCWSFRSISAVTHKLLIKYNVWVNFTVIKIDHYIAVYKYQWTCLGPIINVGNNVLLFSAFKFCFPVLPSVDQLCCLTKNSHAIQLVKMINCFEFHQQKTFGYSYHLILTSKD